MKKYFIFSPLEKQITHGKYIIKPAHIGNLQHFPIQRYLFLFLNKQLYILRNRRYNLFINHPINVTETYFHCVQ